MKTWTEIIDGKEVKVVNSRWHNVELQKLNRKLYELSGNRIEVFSMRISDEEPIQMGVNWVAIGTVSPEETAQFAENLATAAKLAAEYKYNGYIERFVSWKDVSDEEMEELRTYLNS